MLKSKNQVSLFVNYSYNSFYDFCSSENIYSKRRYVPKYGTFDFMCGLYMDIPSTDIHVSGPAICILYPMVTNGLHWCLLTKVTSNYQLFFYRNEHNRTPRCS